MDASGAIVPIGDAPDYGSAERSGQPVVGIAATPDGGGYWLASADGGVFAFGDAGFWGAANPHQLSKPVVGIAATPDGRGYWLASADGRVFAFGDARFWGAANPHQLSKPVVGIAATPDGRGYWLASADGGVFAFGDAGFWGAANPHQLSKPVVGIAPTANGQGYWLASGDGTVFAFGDAGVLHSAYRLPRASVVALVPSGDNYYLVTTNHRWTRFGPRPVAPVPVVLGNQLMSGTTGKPLRLLGVDAGGTEDACLEDMGFSPGPLNAAEANAIASWHVNAVRVPLDEDCWLDINGVPSRYSGRAYQDMIVQWVSYINNAGMVAILDLHRAAPGTVVPTQEWPMADQDHSVLFWRQVASIFASDPSVVFDLFNEPFIGSARPTSADWSCWLKGCTTSYHDISYQTAGMQELLDTVRATGATQPVMVGGLNWADDPCGVQDLDGNGGQCLWLANEPADPEHQVLASFHSYNSTVCATEACWDTSVLPLLTRVPVVTGELGEDDCSALYVDAYMQWADRHNISYLAWSWVPASSSETCAAASFQLLSNWSGSPSAINPIGGAVAAHLASLAGALQSADLSGRPPSG